jgi:hypothetical protein
MYVHKQAKIAYLAHPRTASTATCTALREQAGFVSAHRHHATPVEAKRKWPQNYPDGIDLKDDWIIFSTVRNHFEVFRSEFLNTNYHRTDEPELNPEVLHRLMDTSLYWRPEGTPPFTRLFYHVPFCTTVVRHEHLNKRVNFILRSRDLEEVDIPQVNTSDQTDQTYKELFTDEGRKWVQDRHAIELKRYGYKW